MKFIVLVIKAFNDFVTGVLGSERAASIIPGLSRASTLGYWLIIPKDCVEAPVEKAQNESLKYMKNMYGAKIVTSKELMEKGVMEVLET